MVTLINCHNRFLHGPLLDAMHADRKRVFVDLLRWPIGHEDGREQDQFDDEDASYLIVSDPVTGLHLGSLRLLRTDRPHILSSLFPDLCTGPVPQGPHYREITRLCLAPGIGRAARLACRNLLARSLVEYALLTGLRGYTGVAQMAWLTQILSAGWTCRALGAPKMIDHSLLGALLITIDHRTMSKLDSGWRCGNAPLRVVEFDIPIAA